MFQLNLGLAEVLALARRLVESERHMPALLPRTCVVFEPTCAAAEPGIRLSSPAALCRLRASEMRNPFLKIPVPTCTLEIRKTTRSGIKL